MREMLQTQSNRKFSKPIIIATLCLALAACAEGREGQTIGTVAGGALGAVLGSQFGGGKGQLAAVAIGAIAGAWAGSELGKKLDEEDKVYAPTDGAGRHGIQQGRSDLDVAQS
jgi:outer membrane lipoprotein SlyB